MQLSIVVIFYDMPREAPRTLYSLSPQYQQQLASSEYEVIAIDNGSEHPIDGARVAAYGDHFRYMYKDTSSPSPVDAVNDGARLARGDHLAVIVDGARMASPGLIGQTQRAVRLHPKPFVCSLSWHLGPDEQRRSMLVGYDQEVEDRLLEEIEWPSDGYRLFDVSRHAPSSKLGFLDGVPSECSWWAMRRADFLGLGGFDSRFVSPGGGLVNQDFRNRALALDGVSPTVLLGEGVFHQFHGGVSTNASPDRRPNAIFQAEYERIHGRRYAPTPQPAATFYGKLRRVPYTDASGLDVV